jgi:hypothetical protein
MVTDMENFEGKKIPKMELAEVLKQLRDISSEEVYGSVKGILFGQEKQAGIESAIDGLSQEDEFGLMCRLMGTVETLVRLDQKKIILGDYEIPDFIGRFQPGCWHYGFSSEDSSGFRCCIEVKSTNNLKFKFGGRALKGLRNFSEQIGFPLIFAIRFLRFSDNQYWLIVEDTNRERNTITAEVSDLGKDIRHILWDEYLFFLVPGVRFVFIYKNNGNEEGIGHEKYGELVGLKILNAEEVLDFTGIEAKVLAFFYESFELEERDIRTEGSKTYVLMVPELYLVFLADLVYKSNMLMTVGRRDTVYEPSRILASSRQGPAPFLVDRGFVENVGRRLLETRSLFLVSVGETDTLLERWRKYGGAR